MKSIRNCRRLAAEEYQAKADQLKSLRKMVRECLESEGCEKDFVQRMVLAVNEASMNIIQHAYGNRETDIFRVEIFSDNKELTFCLTDFAPEVDQQSIKSRELDDIRPGGLGVHFINELMDQVEFLRLSDDKAVNVLQMKKLIE